MILFSLACLLGFGLLIWSADRFVAGAAALASFMGMPILLVGMVIIGFGTSMPEIMLSLLAAIEGKGGLAIGNAYGSNIANIGLILGIAALFTPIKVRRQVIRRETPILIAITLLSITQLIDGELGRVDSLMLLGSFVFLMGISIRRAMREEGHQPEGEASPEMRSEAATDSTTQPNTDSNTDSNTEITTIPALGRTSAIVHTVGGLVLLLVGAKLLVWGAVGIAEAMQVSEVLIGLTVVALGTSLPELASTLSALRRGHHEMAIGGIIGSNLFNTLVVVGIAGIINPISIELDLLQRDLPVMAALTIALFVFMYRRQGTGLINRVKASVLLAGYTGYIALLAIAALSVS